MNTDQIALAKSLRLAGWSLDRIAARLGVSRFRVTCAIDSRARERAIAKNMRQSLRRKEAGVGDGNDVDSASARLIAIDTSALPRRSKWADALGEPPIGISALDRKLGTYVGELDP